MNQQVVAIYIRVSTEEQASQGFSLDAQKDRLISYCKSQGWDEYEIFNDDGYSGTNLERPAMQRLIRAAQKKRIGTVVVYRLDRLSRRQRDVLHLLEEVFEKNDITFKSATEPFDTSTPLGKAMLGILAVFAQLERETIIERVTEGHHRRARSGLWGGGPEPYGYRWNKDEQKLEIVEKEARIVRGLFERVIAGQSFSQIALWAKANHPNKWWDHNVIRNTVARQVYLGNIAYGNHVGDGNHEAIIDEETFQRANLELNRRVYHASPLGQYLLSGLLRCGECGEPIGHARVSSRNYYVCARKHRGKRYYKPGDPCTSKHFRSEWLEKEVIVRLLSVASNPEAVEELMSSSTAAVSKDDIAQLNKDIQQINRRIQRWDDAYEAEEISRQKWREKIHPLEEERMRLEQAIDELESKLQGSTGNSELLRSFELIREAWDDDMEFTEKQSVLRSIINKIIVYKNDKIEIRWNM